MCTVVLRWSPGQPAEVFALRDELVGRPFDDPAAWWPDQPGAVGGRDRVAGGTWCVTDVGSGATALVLNRPERRTAGPGAPSRGLLPLLALQHGPGWAEAVPGLLGMATFTLLLAGPDGLHRWDLAADGLRHEPLGAGTHLVTSGGAEDGRSLRYRSAFDGPPSSWRAALTAPEDDRSALVVRHEGEAGRVFATVFGQRLTAEPGRLALSWSREPWQPSTWQARTWTAPA